ncbi:sensor histidine kinase [Paraliomyxa miuraensis]|uniref:sensor histidine kinase n=1 Tax=Paraliomyxa miuraensis TaxID=376150 RepID=UPI0022520E18|nr:HAMP domain-containing sensor histidine kinase [Paraliomyxa miuraensis]MCX4243260.1 HAMP domain-containing histidine kinase [Paraliomyxa miuraensis]
MSGHGSEHDSWAPPEHAGDEPASQRPTQPPPITAPDSELEPEPEPGPERAASTSSVWTAPPFVDETRASQRPTEPPPTTLPEVIRSAPSGSPVGPVLRLSVELRLLGMVATLWGLGLLHAASWALWVGLPLHDLASLPWGQLLLPQGLALVLTLGHGVSTLPRPRWARRNPSARGSDPWPWLVAGPAALLLAPVLWHRDRSERATSTTSPAEVEAAFQGLLRAPRSIALRVASWGALAYGVDAVVLGAHTGWPRHVVIAMALLWIAILGPMAAMVHGWGRAMVRPEILSAPRVDPGTGTRRSDLRGPLVLMATAAAGGAIAAPLAAGYLWLAVASPVHAPPPALVELLLLVGLLALMGCVTAFVRLAMDLRRDVLRAAAQVGAVVREEPPEALWPGTLATGEVHQLVGAVDRLIERIRQATIAKYVAIERAKEGDRIKSQFLANMSHDLRSPLNSILGFSELLLRGIDGELLPEQREMVQSIHDNGRELLLQIDDILDTAKLEAHRLDLSPEPTPPANLISRAIKLARERQRGRLEYETEVAPGLRPAFVDPFRMVQALGNILLFAGELMHEGTLHIHVYETRASDGPRIVVQVRTPVRPATTEQLARARRGFYRIPGHRGLGLGLPMAAAILELSGGSLVLEDLGNKGMVITTMIPAPQSKATYLRMRAIEGPTQGSADR